MTILDIIYDVNYLKEAINFPNENVVAGYPYYTIFNRRLSMERIMYGWHNHSVNMLWYMMVFRPDTPEVVNRIKETELEWNQELEVRALRFLFWLAVKLQYKRLI
uniref:Glyco_hydro81C domain-containing protein n=1 Tax=Ascaris lumbricoides TaxID=6252 RepID=A0A0M3HLG4_ASCLU